MAFPQLINALYNAQVGNANLRIKRYPRTSDAAALVGVTVTSGKSYAYGAWAEVVAAAGITSDFWLVGQCPNTLVVADEHIIQSGSGGAGSEVVLVEIPYVITQTTAAGEGYELPIFHMPVKVAASTRVAARSTAASANNRATVLALLIATSLGS